MLIADARGPHLTLLPVAALLVSTTHKVCLLQITDAYRSPYRLVHRFLEPCCQEDSNTRRLTISHQDRCCVGSRQCCMLDPQNRECHQGIFRCFDARALASAHSLTVEDGCSDCTPSGQACLIPSGPKADREDNVVASAAECGCCDCLPKGHSARGQSSPIPTGSITDNESNVAAATTEDDCCSDCTLKCHPARGQVHPVDIEPAEKKDIVVTSTVNTRAST
jgi:hypothetical protein